MKNFHQKMCVTRFTERSFTTLIICLTMLITALVQCNPATAAIRAVVIEGEAAPGFDDGFIFSDLAGAKGAINNSGQAVFTATVNTILNSGSTNYFTLWRENSGTAELIARTKEIAPGISGSALFSSFSNPNINDPGQVAFIARLTEESGGNSVTDVSLWKGTPGSISMVAREGDTAPGYSGDTFGEMFSAIGGDTVAFNNDGRVAFINNLNNASARNSVWQENASGLTMLAKTGWAVPGFADATYGEFHAGIPLNNNGDLAFFPNIVGNFDWTHLTGAYLVQKAINGNVTTKYTGFKTAAPGVAGKTFQSFPTGSQNYDMNASGQLVFEAALEYGGTVDHTNISGIWSDAFGSLALVARQGSQATGTPADAVFSSFNSPLVMNDSGQVAFGASLKTDAGGVDNTNNNGIWLETGGVLDLIARAGDRAPGTPDGVVFNSQFINYAINSAGQVCFHTSMTGPGIDYTNSAGIWLYDPSDGLSLVVREGDEVTLTSGETVTFIDIVADFPGSCSGGSDGRARYFNNSGEIAFKAAVSPGYREGFFIANTDNGSATELIADAGANQSAAEGNTVALDASGSTATGSTIATYSWTQTDSSGITITLSSSTSINPTFTAPQVDSSTTLIFSLTVTDSVGSTSTDSVSITISNSGDSGDTDNTDDDSSTTGCFISNLK